MAHDTRAEDIFMEAPAHPVPQLQGPFEESMLEIGSEASEAQTRMDAVARRTMLLEAPKYERLIAGRWKQKPGERFHPLWKITAQLSFGMHLLAEGMAKSEDEVMKILQSHVDDIDSFLERTTEDFDLAESDVSERLRYLKLPLEHVAVFDRMLEDRTFRTSIVEGNEKIEHIIDRTSDAMKDALKDVQKGLDSTHSFGNYLTDLGNTWDRSAPEHEAVYVAMLGNVEGWSRAFVELHRQGNKLSVILLQLAEIVAEMQRRAGVVSRTLLLKPHGRESLMQPYRNTLSKSAYRGSARPRTSASSPLLSQSPRKGLPTAPDVRTSYSDKQTLVSGDRAHRTLESPSSTTSSGPKAASSAYAGRSTDSRQSGRHSANRSSHTTPTPNRPASPAKHAPPIELPADVPTQMLLQAPMSKQNRLSMALGSAGKQRTDDGKGRPLSIALAQLLKSPMAGHASGAPKLSPKDAGLESGAGPAPSNDDLASEASVPVSEKANGTANAGVASMPKPYRPGLVTSRGASFTSHPPDSAGEAGSKHALRETSLGEPGPELAATGASQGVVERARASQTNSPQDVTPMRTPLRTPLSTTASPALSELDVSRPVNKAVSTTSEPVELEAPRHQLAASTSPTATDAPGMGVAKKAVAAQSESVPMQPPLYIGEDDDDDDSSDDDLRKPVSVASPPTATRIALPQVIITRRNLDTITEDRKSLPPPLKATAVQRRELKRPAHHVKSILIEHLAATPPDSPIHTRHPSGDLAASPPAMTISATPMMGAPSSTSTDERPSHFFAPPQEAPAPPGPGGRAMVNPDYAAAAAFEGERRPTRHRSSSSASSWKNLFSSIAGGAHNHSNPGSDARPASARGVDMMTAGGKDVLWFKGMGNDGQWVSST